MVRGLIHWQDRNRYSTQTNNSIEAFHKAEGKTRGWTESCGPTSATTLLDMMGVVVEMGTPGGWRPQPEQVLWDYLNDPRNYPKFAQARPNLVPGAVPPGRCPETRFPSDTPRPSRRSSAAAASFGPPFRSTTWPNGCRWARGSSSASRPRGTTSPPSPSPSSLPT